MFDSLIPRFVLPGEGKYFRKKGKFKAQSRRQTAGGHGEARPVYLAFNSTAVHRASHKRLTALKVLFVKKKKKEFIFKSHNQL